MPLTLAGARWRLLVHVVVTLRRTTATLVASRWRLPTLVGGAALRDASEGKGLQRLLQRSLDTRLEEVAEAVTVGYECH